MTEFDSMRTIGRRTKLRSLLVFVASRGKEIEHGEHKVRTISWGLSSLIRQILRKPVLHLRISHLRKPAQRETGRMLVQVDPLTNTGRLLRDRSG